MDNKISNIKERNNIFKLTADSASKLSDLTTTEQEALFNQISLQLDTAEYTQVGNDIVVIIEADEGPILFVLEQQGNDVYLIKQIKVFKGED